MMTKNRIIEREQLEMLTIEYHIVPPGNVHDNNMLEPLIRKIFDQVGLPVVVAADTAYKTPAIAIFLIENQIHERLLRLKAKR